MKKRIFNVYKIPLLISFTLFVVLLALRVERDPVQIAFIFLGVLLGTLLLDFDYFIYAHFFEPETEFSKQVRGYTKDGDFLGALNYIIYHKNEIKDKVLNSALFQIALAALVIIVVGSTTSIMLKALTLSAFVNSMYRMSEEYFENRLSHWFWAFKEKPSKNTFYLYASALLLVLLFSLSLF